MNAKTELRAWCDRIPPPDEETIDRALERLEAAMAQPATGPRRRRSERLRLRLLFAGVAAASLVAGAAALLPSGEQPVMRILGVPAPAAAAAAKRSCFVDRPSVAGCLEAVAGVAGSRDLVALDQVYYTRTYTPDQGGATIAPGNEWNIPTPEGPFNVELSSVTDIWVEGDGSVYSSTRFDRLYFPTPHDREVWKRNGSPDLSTIARLTKTFSPNFKGTAEQFFLNGGGDFARGLGVVVGKNPVARLPTDPRDLIRVIREVSWWQRVVHSGERGCARDLDPCGDVTRWNIEDNVSENLIALLSYPFTPPDLRGAALEALASRPGADVLGKLTDPRGRTGVAVVVPYADRGIPGASPGSSVLLIDPSTALLLDEAIISVRKATPEALDHIFWLDELNVDAGIVDKVGAVPPR